MVARAIGLPLDVVDATPVAIDTAGNAYLRAPGLYVFVQGEKRHEPAVERVGIPARGGTATALRAAFVLLCRPELLNAPYREIAGAAGTSSVATGDATALVAGIALLVAPV